MSRRATSASVSPTSFDGADYSAALARIQSDEYIRGSAATKQEILWKFIAARPYEQLPRLSFSFFGSIWNTFYIPGLRPAFTVLPDIRPPRTKAFHPHGTVATMEWVPAGKHSFTGFFETGGVGLARLSLAMGNRMWAPSAAFKLFVDGDHPSENLVLDQSLDKQTSRDFFERAPTNHTLWPTLVPMKLVWWAVDRWLAQIGPALYQSLEHLAAVRSDGETVAAPHAPHTVFLYAPPEVHTNPDATDDFRELLGYIPVGSTIYKVYARPTEQSNEQIYVGYITTTSPFVASSFGDHILALRHAPNPGSPIARRMT